MNITIFNVIRVSEMNDALIRHKLIVEISIISIGLIISGTPTMQKYAITKNVAKP